MKFILLISLFFNLNLLAAQGSFVSPKDTTKFVISKPDTKSELLKTIYNSFRDSQMSNLLFYCKPDVNFSFIRDSVIIKSQNVTNYKAIEILKNLEKINYGFFKIQYDIVYNGHNIFIVSLYKTDQDIKSSIEVYLMLDSANSIKEMIISWNTPNR